MYKFIFCSYKIHPKVDKRETSWFLHIETQNEFDNFIQLRATELYKQYNWLKMNEVDSNGKTKDFSHICNADALTIWNILSLDQDRKSILDDIKHIDSLLDGYRRVWDDKNHLLINCMMGCCFMDDSFKILDTKIQEHCSFPTTSEGYRINKWPAGKHYYITVYGSRGVGSINLPEKFNSAKEAEKVAKQWLKENIKK